MTDIVLVTGGSGSIGGWAIIGLLRQGYSVRTTVRNVAKQAEVLQHISAHAGPDYRLEFFEADLNSDAGWDAAVRGCTYVLHVAAPVGVEAPRDPDELIKPTRDGALRVLRAACRARVRRVVMTSAVEACRPPMDAPDGTFDETTWTDTNDAKLGPYRVAKALAERAAWDFMARHSGQTSLATILPSAVTGPPLGAGNLHSAQLPLRMLNGSLPRCPRIGFCIVDVRDVVDLHIRAMTAPEAAGERFIAASDWMWMVDVARVLRSELGANAKKVPTKRLPDFVVRIVALFQRPMRFAVPLLGRKHVFTSTKAKAVLGWTPRTAAATLVETARSLIASGAL